MSSIKVRSPKTRAAPTWMAMEELQRLLASVDVLETLPPQELREITSPNERAIPNNLT
jgi:hypothetical protein